MSYNEIINKFIEDNYTFLLECSTNILKGQKTEPGDLIAELCLYIYDNESKLSLLEGHNALLAFSISWMNLQSRYKTTPFNLKYKRDVDYTESDLKKIDNIIEEEVEIEISDKLKDLKRIYTDKQCENILKVNEIIPELSITNQIIYKLYFEDLLSCDKIKNRYNFFKKQGDKITYYKSKSSIAKMVNELKSEIRKKL